MTIREKLDKVLREFECMNLGAETARSALIDSILRVVDDSFEKRAMRILNKEKEEELEQFDAVVDDNGSVWRREGVIHPD